MPAGRRSCSTPASCAGARPSAGRCWLARVGYHTAPASCSRYGGRSAFMRIASLCLRARRAAWETAPLVSSSSDACLLAVGRRPRLAATPDWPDPSRSTPVLLGPVHAARRPSPDPCWRSSVIAGDVLGVIRRVVGLLDLFVSATAAAVADVTVHDRMRCPRIVEQMDEGSELSMDDSPACPFAFR